MCQGVGPAQLIPVHGPDWADGPLDYDLGGEATFEMGDFQDRLAHFVDHHWRLPDSMIGLCLVRDSESDLPDIIVFAKDGHGHTPDEPSA